MHLDLADSERQGGLRSKDQLVDAACQKPELCQAVQVRLVDVRLSACQLFVVNQVKYGDRMYNFDILNFFNYCVHPPYTVQVCNGLKIHHRA